MTYDKRSLSLIWKTNALPLSHTLKWSYSVFKLGKLIDSGSSTFEFSGFQQFLPLGADFLHATSHLSGRVMLSIQKLLARLLQSIDAALISRQLSFKSLVFLHFTLQVGGVLLSSGHKHRGEWMRKKK